VKVEPDAFNGAVAGPGRRVSAEGRAARGLGGRRGDMAEVSFPRRSTSAHFVFSEAGCTRSRTGSREEHEKAHGSSADTRLASLRGWACSCCSCSAGSTRVLGVAVLRPHRISIARLRPALFFLSTLHDIERLQALGVLLRSGSIGLGLTFWRV